MIHFVLHDARDTVAVVVVEGVKAGTAMTGWIMDEDKTIQVQARQDIPIGHKVALKDMAPGDTVLKYGDRKSTRLNSSHPRLSRMPSSA